MTCSKCRVENVEGAKFCSNCGTALNTPRPVEGERRVVTILFADVVGSTSLAEQVDPEVWAELMNGALGFMIAAVNRYEGTVGRLMGDAILALFGAPIAHEDDAVRAVLAAVDVRTASAEYAAALKRDYGLDFAVRVGVNTGLSVVTTVGDDTKAEYTAMGDAANVAARLQSLASPQGILIGPETYALVRHAVDTRKRESDSLRGKTETIATYEVLEPKQVAERARGLDGVSSPFVGRKTELRVLGDLLRAADGGHARLAFLVGEAGLGKSRLIAELKERTGGDVLWLEAKGLPYARTSPYHPWRQLLLDQATRGDGAPEWTGVLAQLAGGGDERADSGGVSAVDAERFAGDIVRAMAQHLERLARTRTVVLVIEDFHWADQASVSLVERIAVTLRDERVLIVLLARPDRTAPAWDLMARAQAGAVTGLSQQPIYMTVSALERGDSKALLDSMLDIEGMPDAVAAKILDKAEGNPFYLEEMLKSLIDSGHIVAEGRSWRAGSQIGDVSLPNTLSAVLSARIDMLAEPTRDVVQTAAVIGRDFGSGLLSAVMRDVARASASDVVPHLTTLTREDLINRVLDVENDYRFKHELTRDAAYQRLLLRRRRELHTYVARELEAQNSRSLPAIAKLLAHHYQLGEQWLDAARHSLTAARQAVRLYAVPESLELFEATLAATDRFKSVKSAETGAPDLAADNKEAKEKEAKEMAIDAGVGWVNAATISRFHEDPARRPAVIARGEEAVARARTLDDEFRLVSALVALGNVHILSGFPGAGFGYLGEASDTALRLGDEHLFLQPFWAATERMVDDDPVAAVSQFDRVIALARKVGHKAIEAHALGTKAAALARLGEFAKALESGEQALQAAEESGSTIKMADVNALVGTVYLEMGMADLGTEYGERGADLALSVQGMECACAALHVTGIGEMQRQHLPAANDKLRRSLEYGTGTAFEPWLHNVRISLANTELRAGESAAAVETIEQELAKAEAIHDGFGAANGRLALAEALLARGEAGRAEEQMIKSVQWFRERTMVPYLARALWLRGRAEKALGKVEAGAATESEALLLTATLERAVSDLGFPRPCAQASRDAAGS